MKAPCEECLKMALCLGQGLVECKDLAHWLVRMTGRFEDDGRVNRINYFESKVWNKDVSTINSSSGEIRFKDTIRDHYSALIVA